MEEGMSLVYKIAEQTRQYDDSCIMAVDTGNNKFLAFLKNGVSYRINITPDVAALYYEDGQFWPVDEEYKNTVTVKGSA